MPIFKAVENGKGIGAFKNVLNYLVRADKDEEDKKVLINGIGVSNDPQKALKQMIYNKLVHNKLDKEALYKQFTQSYDSKDKDKLTPELVHKMGVLFAEENFEKYGFKCVVVTHFEKDHIHNHFFVDNVNIESGLKYVILDDRAKNSKQYKKKIEQGKLKNHERLLEDLKKSSDDIAFFYGIDRVEKGDKSINIYNKKLYTSIEKGFLGKVIRNWNSILYDKTTNLSNFIEVLQSKGIYAKVDNHEVYFSRKEIKDNKKDNYVRLSYLKDVLNYQFKQSETENTFEFKKSMELLDKQKIKEKDIREVADTDKRSNGKEKEKEKAEIEKEVQLNLKKKGLINLIKEYKKETDKVIESYYTPFRKELKQVIEDKFNDNTKVKKFMEEFNRDINTKSNFTPDEYKKELTYFILTELEKGEENLNKRISADYVRDTFKRGTSEFVYNSTPFFQLKTEDIMNSKIVRENSSTENSKRILKDKFLKELPTDYEIKKMNEKTLEETINAVLKTFKNGIEEIKKYIEKSTEYKLKERAKDIFIKDIGKNNIDSIEEIKRDFVKIYNEYKDNSNVQLTNEVKKITKEYKELKEIEEKEEVLKKKDDYEYSYSSSSTSTTTKTTTTVEEKVEKNALEDAIKNQRLAEEQRLRDLANAESNNKKKVKSVIVEDKGNKGKDREIE